MLGDEDFGFRASKIPEREFRSNGRFYFSLPSFHIQVVPIEHRSET
jgi:hypothetical protein